MSIVHGYSYNSSQLLESGIIETDCCMGKNSEIKDGFLYTIIFHNASSYRIPSTILMQEPSMYVAKMNLQTHVLKETYLGERGSDPHYDPSLIIAPNGSIYVFSCYYPNNITYWVGDQLTLQFIKYTTQLRGYSYPCPFILNGNIYLLTRQTVVLNDEDGMPIGFDLSLAIIDMFHGFNVWKTVWKWQSGNQGECYYFDLAVENNRLFVATTGQRINAEVEKRKGVLFGYSDDLHQWFDMSGRQLYNPAQMVICDWNVSRVSITVADGKPVILAGYVWVSHEAHYYIGYYSSSWSFFELPVDNGYACWSGGFNSVQMINGDIHAVVGVQQSLSYVDTADIYHYCSSSPYSSWNKTRITEGYTNWRNAGVLHSGSALYVLHFDQDWKQYLTTIDVGVVPEYSRIFLLGIMILLISVVVVYAKKH